MYGLMEENTMENGRTIYKMDKVNSCMPMELSTTVTGLMGLRTEKACRIGKMARNTKEIGLITPCKVWVITSLLMEVNMTEIGSTISSMEMEDKPGQMVEAMKASSIMELKKVKASTHGLTVRNTMELGPTVNNMERVLSQLPKEKSEEVFGQTVLDLNGLRKHKKLIEKKNQKPKLWLKLEKTKKRPRLRKN